MAEILRGQDDNFLIRGSMRKAAVTSEGVEASFEGKSESELSHSKRLRTRSSKAAHPIGRLATTAFAVDWGATRPDFMDRMTPSYGTTCLGFPFARCARM
jgi:hypothetical protein